jgi:hypothetical protein
MPLPIRAKGTMEIKRDTPDKSFSVHRCICFFVIQEATVGLIAKTNLFPQQGAVGKNVVLNCAVLLKVLNQTLLANNGSVYIFINHSDLLFRKFHGLSLLTPIFYHA